MVLFYQKRMDHLSLILKTLLLVIFVVFDLLLIMDSLLDQVLFVKLELHFFVFSKLIEIHVGSIEATVKKKNQKTEKGGLKTNQERKKSGGIPWPTATCGEDKK